MFLLMMIIMSDNLPSCHPAHTPACLLPTQQTRDVHSVPVQCWASVADSGPTLNRHCVNVSCLLGIYDNIIY